MVKKEVRMTDVHPANSPYNILNADQLKAWLAK